MRCHEDDLLAEIANKASVASIKRFSAQFSALNLVQKPRRRQLRNYFVLTALAIPRIFHLALRKSQRNLRKGITIEGHVEEAERFRGKNSPDQLDSLHADVGAMLAEPPVFEVAHRVQEQASRRELHGLEERASHRGHEHLASFSCFAKTVVV